MSLYETEALVLRTYNLAEADKIVVCLTRSHGLVRGVAKGSRRLKNRFGAALEPFTIINLSYFQKENQELASFGQTEILSSHFNLSSDAETYAAMCYMSELVIDFSPPHQPNEKLFRMVKACIDAIAASPSDLQTILRYFEVWILKLEGFLPDIRRCGECGESFAEKGIPFLSSDLTLRCRGCSHGGGTALSANLYGQLEATHKMAPQLFAAESRKVSPKILVELAELTHSLIGRVLERQPRVRPTFS